MLHWRLNHERINLVPAIPEPAKQSFAASYKSWCMRVMMIQRELLLTVRILPRAQIPHVALKGAYLAFHAYPNPALRPMRDLDIMVPKAQALIAYQHLIDEGLSRTNKSQGSPEAYMKLSQHLPPLRSNSGNVSVELHAQLTHPEHCNIQSPDLSEDQTFWGRLIQCRVANETVTYESPTDLLLHMILHAVYQHQFDNGPLILSDLAYLIEAHPIDWTLFWAQATRGGHVRGCVLALKLLEYYWGPQAIDWPLPHEFNETPSDEILQSCALLMLRDGEVVHVVNLTKNVAKRSSGLDKFRVLLDKAFPSKTKVASYFPVSEYSWKVYLWYVVWWRRLITQGVPELIRSKLQGSLRHEVDGLNKVNAWLAQ